MVAYECAKENGENKKKIRLFLIACSLKKSSFY